VNRDNGAIAILAAATILVLAVVAGVLWYVYGRSGHILDEAYLASPPRDAASFPAADEDYFHDMDQDRNGPVTLSREEIQGRNTWLVWTAGDDRLWDALGVKSAGALEFLKVLSSHPSQKYGRQSRWEYFGLVNEPCFEKASGPDPQRWNLWLDKRKPDCPPDPFENAAKYPGVRFGSRGHTVNGKPFDAGSYYGYATGIVGFRLFPNPEFDDRAAARWDAEKFYTDPAYAEDKTLVRPYRVGMSCALCHAGPNPIKPPADPDNPEWANLSSNVGAQYFWTDRIFYQAADFENFSFQLFHASRPGSLDTSFVSTDSINNPRTMNAVYLLGPRLLHAKHWGKETLKGGNVDNHQFNDYLNEGPLTQLFQRPDIVWTPRVLKDGADSVGAMGALNRVYLNIGTFSEEWLTHFNALVGGQPITPIRISVARENSAYFKATEAQTFNMARFFLKTTGAHHLADAPDGQKHLTTDESVLTRGKVAFAENCARCHSSKLPPTIAALDPDGCAGKDYLGCWSRYWETTQTTEFKQQMRDIVMKPDFLQDNYLSSEFRVPVTLLQTNACSPLATNALGGNIWDNFSSQSYKELPSVGEITYYHPYTGEPRTYKMPAGGRGYTRPPSLVSLWSTAPFLLNNTMGRFEESPSVEARMRSFNDSIHKMLWPEDRDKDSLLGAKIPGVIDRVGDRAPEGHGTQPVYLKVGAGYLPDFLRQTLSAQKTLFPELFTDEGVRLGPIPPGTPIGLISNINLLSDDPDPLKRTQHAAKVGDVVVKILARLHALGGSATNDQAKAVFADLVEPLLEVSKCPDFVVNRGHLFGTNLPNDDKAALIEFLKTF
jgi:mono/diheme cytochrome c family protein